MCCIFDPYCDNIYGICYQHMLSINSRRNVQKIIQHEVNFDPQIGVNDTGAVFPKMCYMVVPLFEVDLQTTFAM